MGRRNRGETQDDSVIRAETAFLLSQLDDIRLQEQFLEEERRKLVEQQEFDFEGLLSRLQAQLAQQQQGFEQQLATSQNILGQLGDRTQQLSGVLDQQAQNREQIARGAQTTLQRGQGLLTGVRQDVTAQSGQTARQLGERAQATTQQARRGDLATQERQRFLAAEGEAAQQRIGQERDRLLSQTQRTEAQNRQRRQEARANLRGTRAIPQQQAPTGLTRQRITRNPESDRQRFLSSLPPNQPGPRQILTEEEYLDELQRLREQNFISPLSGQRRTGNTARRL